MKYIHIRGKYFMWLSDKSFLKLKYWYFFRKKLNLKKPQTFNEKLNWLKLYDRNPTYTTMVDKYAAKQYVGGLIGDHYIIPTFGVYSKFDDINFDVLPNQFVIKCTHNSGGVIICKDKAKLDLISTRKIINRCLNNNYYYHSREWPYKNVVPQLIIEKYMSDDNSVGNLNDYKIFCFNGVPTYVLVCSNRNGNYKNTDFYDFNWKLQPFTRQNHTNNPLGIVKPKRLDEMYEIAKKLSSGIPFVRVDLYEIKSKVYFGEMTFYPSSGFEGFNPIEWDKKLGDLLKLNTDN